MDRSMAYLLAQAAGAVYLRQPQLDGFTVYPIRKDNTTAFIFVNNLHVIVAFRGTDELTDARLDLRFWRRKLHGHRGTYHRGFVRAFRRVRYQVLSRLAFVTRNKQIWIVGHSLGGALAILLATELASLRKAHIISGILTLGAPRVASVLGAHWIDKVYGGRILQFENAGDEVCHVPLAILGYAHCGERVVLGERKRTWNILQKTIRTRVAHRVLRYLHGVKKWANSPG